ncbi:similar to Saccharomyces cerevisiae YML065W ORC1 Largest subunit of the origin recognition complex [Maudiozyma barnettii]|nr:similar to Saccharomyces cerevisiae YML065W ORC1 Largest subunit of the origin recognition complex [Kazachstania barnettii]
MAKTVDKLDDWEVVITDDDGKIVDIDNTRSRRRRNAHNHIHLEKKIDNQIKKLEFGTNIIVKNRISGGPDIMCMIYEIRMSTTNNYLELWTFKYWNESNIDPQWYFKNLDPKVLELNETNEYYQNLLHKELRDNKRRIFTLQSYEVNLKDIIGFVDVVKGSEWTSQCTPGKTFIVDYMCSANGKWFAPIDFKKEIERLKNKSTKEILEGFSSVLSEEPEPEPKTNGKKNATIRKTTDKKVSKIIKSKEPADDESMLENTDDESIGDLSSEDEYIDPDETANAEKSFANESEEEEEEEDDDDEDDEDEVDEDEDIEYEKPSKGKRKSRSVKKKEPTDSKKPARKKKKITKAQLYSTQVRRFTKRNVVRAKKKYTPFSKQYRSIKDIPDLTNFGGFNMKNTDEYFDKLEDKLNTKSDHKIVETIFSKVKKQLYSSRGKEEIVKSTNFGEYLPARENEFASIYLSIYSALESGSSTTVYIAGTPGVGKTLTVREVMKELQHSASQKELPPFQYIEINGLKMVKPTDSYEVLWSKISGDNLTWGAAMESLQFYFEKVPKDKKRPIVVLLDELDALITKQEDIMYNFFNWTSYENSKLIVVAVANTMDLPERQLGNKVSSRIGFTRIMFAGYTHEELKSIIDLRLQGLNDTFFYVDKDSGNAYLADNFSIDEKKDKLPSNLKKVRLRMSSDAIEIASRKIASVSGDARRALKACKRAAEIAEQHYMAVQGYNYDGQVIVESKENEDDVELQDTEEVQSNVDATADGYETEVDENGNEYEVQVVRINHIMRALNETINTNITKFINRCSFTTKLFLFAFLNLIKKTGYEEQNLGDVVDEIKLLIEVNGNNKFVMKITDVLYPKELGTEAPQLRMISWDYIMCRLIESGIIVKQNSNNERYCSIKLNVPSDEVNRAVEQDDHLKDF